ncbi:MAG: zinc dependent phospholipase C family protein [Deltaproteobacteria bacterium]|nr:zinc dependent phospholipase C family protein [Deltaproteobacteria bacterium]
MATAIIIVTIIALAMLFPSEALAWGPATHLELGTSVLRSAAELPPGVYALIQNYSHDFLYGNVSADIVVGKNFTEELKHCHNWRFGFKLLKKAKTDSQRSFAYGYIAHLAADTVAHNNFIPEMLIRTFSTRIHRHVYWEMRFDALVNKAVWKIPAEMERKIHTDNDALLASTLEGTPLSFGTNKTIFSGIMNLHRIKRWHAMIGLMSKISVWDLDTDMKERYFNAAFERIMDVLNNGEDAASLKHDPTGKASLKAAKTARSRLKRLKNGGRDWEKHLQTAINGTRINTRQR